MSVPPTRPALRERYDRRHRRVVQEAARLFAQRGYQATSMADLTAATGLTAGGLYHYIGSKERLLISICDELLEPLLEEAEAIVADPAAPEARLRRLVGAWLAHIEHHLEHMVVFQQERRVIEREPQWQRIRESRKRFEQLLDGVLEELHAAGALAHPDPRIALRALLGMVNHTPQWFRPGGPLATPQLADGYCDLVLHGRP